MKYETQILAAFQRLGFRPRENQVEAVNEIVTAFLDEGVKNLILSAPTGTGKSIIGAVAAEVVHDIKHPGNPARASFLLTATNALAEQYCETFDNENPDKFLIVKGAGNYTCTALSTADEPQSAEVCAIRVFRKTGMENLIHQYCDSCDYLISRGRRNTSRHLITNYAYYFIDRLYSPMPMEKRTITVFDEAHLLNDLFTEQKSIFFSGKRLDAFSKELAESLTSLDSTIFKDLKTIREHLAAKKIDDSNYRAYLKLLLRVYNTAGQMAEREAEKNIRVMSKHLKMSKLAKKYKNLSCSIDDLFLFEYPHVFDFKSRDPKKGQPDDEVSVKPIFVGEMFEALDNADHNLLMSATISEQFVKRTMTLPGTTKFLKLKPQFSPSNKKVIFFRPQTLNYESMKKPETIKRLCASAYQLVKHHVEQGQRGIILTPSFVVTQSIAETLRQQGKGYKVFEHERGEKLADVLEEFRRYSAGPAVLLTPSGFEGVDLPGDLSRFQIVVKMPYASLGDRRVKTILDNFPDIYGLTALKKLVQGAGRSVRSHDDYATTYILDAAAQKAWTAKTNIWQDEFETSFRSTLEEE